MTDDRIPTDAGTVRFNHKVATGHGDRFRNRGETVIGTTYNGVNTRTVRVDRGGLTVDTVEIEALKVTETATGGKREWWIDVNTGDVFQIHPDNEHKSNLWVNPLGRVEDFEVLDVF